MRSRVRPSSCLRAAIASSRHRSSRPTAHPLQRFAGTDDARLAAIRRMAERDDVDVAVAIRGGYGFTRLLDRIDFAALARSGKRWMGHCDFTVFELAALARAGIVTYAGPMAAYDFGARVPTGSRGSTASACSARATTACRSRWTGRPAPSSRGRSGAATSHRRAPRRHAVPARGRRRHPVPRGHRRAPVSRRAPALPAPLRRRARPAEGDAARRLHRLRAARARRRLRPRHGRRARARALRGADRHRACRSDTCATS